MAISIMQRLNLICLSEDANELIKRLMWLSCVEIQSEEISGCSDILKRASADSELTDTQRKLAYIENALENLKDFAGAKHSLLSGKLAVEKRKIALGADGAVIEKAKKICSLAKELRDITAEITQCNNDISSLNPWINYDMPLDYSGTGSTGIMLGCFPSGTDINAIGLDSNLPDLYTVDVINSEKRGVFVCVLYHNSISQRLSRALTESGFTKFDFRDMHLSAKEEIDNRRERTAILKEDYNKASEELKSYAEIKGDLEIAFDAQTTKKAELEAKQKLYTTEKTVYLTAWTPRKSVKAVASALKGMDLWYEFTDPKEDDDVPTALDNNSFAKPFEGVVEMYSMPKYMTFDPTFIMSLFYFVIFGLMTADVGYGLEIFFGGLFLLKKMKPTGGTKNLLSMITICGISSMIMGVLFGSYFGDLPVAIMTNLLGMKAVNLALLFDIVKEPMNFLYLSLIVGALHLITGMAIKFYMLCKNGKPWSAVFDVGSWYVLFLGIGMLIVVPSVGKYIAILGVLMLVLTQGRAEKSIGMKFFKGVISLYDLISYISDLLSYSRIMAMGLAGAVIASVFNILGTMGGVVGVILMVLIGHTLNLAIGVLGTYVHNCRLQYIEFFGKFYEDGGRVFRPLRPDLKYTEIVNNQENK